MKKITCKFVSLLAASVLFAGAFVSCANGSDDSGSSKEKITPLSDSATVSEVAAVETSGTAVVSGNTATLTASNGTYVFTASSQSQGSNSNIATLNTVASSGTSTQYSQATTERGTWNFTVSGASKPKYAGSYTGSISGIGNSTTSLTLKVEKVRNDNDLLTSVVEDKTLTMSFDSDSGTTTFSATIPEVKVSSVTSYLRSSLNPVYNSDTNYNLTSNIDKVDLANGNATYTALASRKSTSRGNIDDNSYKIDGGTYSFPEDGKITITIANKPLTLDIQEDGSIYSAEANEYFQLITASVSIYGYAATTLDGANSKSTQKFVNLYHDTNNTAQYMDFNQVPGQSMSRVTKESNYEKNGNTVTITGDDFSGTATISGETLTFDDITYHKL